MLDEKSVNDDTPISNAAEMAFTEWHYLILHGQGDARKKAIVTLVPDGFQTARKLERELTDLKGYVKGCQDLTGEQGILAVAIKRLKERADLGIVARQAIEITELKDEVANLRERLMQAKLSRGLLLF